MMQSVTPAEAIRGSGGDQAFAQAGVIGLRPCSSRQMTQWISVSAMGPIS
jgi:hypothetical protein